DTVSSSPCVSGVSASPCQSTNPQVIIDAISMGDTSSCTFNIKLVWGDGSPEQAFVARGTPDGKSFLASHTYSAPGSYTITVGVTVASGGCGASSGGFQFTLVGGGPSAAEQGGAPNPSEPPTTCSSGDPVNCATGAFWHTFTDARVPGLGVPLDFTRTY